MSLIERVMESETLSEETKQRFMDGWMDIGPGPPKSANG
jgi:hypothetical protein